MIPQLKFLSLSRGFFLAWRVYVDSEMHPSKGARIREFNVGMSTQIPRPNFIRIEQLQFSRELTARHRRSRSGPQRTASRDPRRSAISKEEPLNFTDFCHIVYAVVCVYNSR